MFRFVIAPDEGPIHIDHPATVSMEGFKECTSLVDEVPVGDNILGNLLMRVLCLPWRGPHIPEKEFGTMGDIPLEPLTQTGGVRGRK